MHNEAQKDDPTWLMGRSRELRAEASQLEAQAAEKALGLTGGNIIQAAVILGTSVGGLRNALRAGHRLGHLSKLTPRRRGRPPTRLEAIAKQAGSLPKLLAQAMPKTKGTKRVRPAAKAKPKAAKAAKVAKLPAGPKFTPEAREEIARAWIVARALEGANQKEFAKKHRVGVSTLREWVAALASPSPAPKADQP